MKDLFSVGLTFFLLGLSAHEAVDQWGRPVTPVLALALLVWLVLAIHAVLPKKRVRRQPASSAAQDLGVPCCAPDNWECRYPECPCPYKSRA